MTIRVTPCGAAIPPPCVLWWPVKGPTLTPPPERSPAVEKALKEILKHPIVRKEK